MQNQIRLDYEEDVRKYAGGLDMYDEIKIFEGNRIRSIWNEEKEEWYFSIIDILGILTESENPRKYWSVFKVRLKKEGNELATICSQLKMKASDGKMRQTDVANMQGIFRIIQSVPSPKAEPFKMWLAEVGKERIDEIIDPELTIDRALETYVQKGYSREWINQRLQAIQVRKELTDAWQDHGVEEGKEYAILTNEISKAWSGMTIREYKDFKGLKKQNLRDNMSSTELILNMLAEAALLYIVMVFCIFGALASFVQGEIGIGISGLVIGFLFSPHGLSMIGATVIAFIELINDRIKAV